MPLPLCCLCNTNCKICNKFINISYTETNNKCIFMWQWRVWKLFFCFFPPCFVISCKIAQINNLFLYRWVPYTKAPNKCELNCMPKGERFYYRHKSKVIDGTRCDEEKLDICVDGQCLVWFWTWELLKAQLPTTSWNNVDIKPWD